MSKVQASIKETIPRTFTCEYPKVHTHVTKVRDALPFPGKLSDVVAWTDAFVERIAYMAHEEELVCRIIRQASDDEPNFCAESVEP